MKFFLPTKPLAADAHISDTLISLRPHSQIKTLIWRLPDSHQLGETALFGSFWGLLLIQELPPVLLSWNSANRQHTRSISSPVPFDSRGEVLFFLAFISHFCAGFCSFLWHTEPHTCKKNKTQTVWICLDVHVFRGALMWTMCSLDVFWRKSQTRTWTAAPDIHPICCWHMPLQG